MSVLTGWPWSHANGIGNGGLYGGEPIGSPRGRRPDPRLASGGGRRLQPLRQGQRHDGVDAAFLRQCALAHLVDQIGGQAAGNRHQLGGGVFGAFDTPGGRIGIGRALGEPRGHAGRFHLAVQLAGQVFDQIGLLRAHGIFRRVEGHCRPPASGPDLAGVGEIDLVPLPAERGVGSLCRVVGAGGGQLHAELAVRGRQALRGQQQRAAGPAAAGGGGHEQVGQQVDRLRRDRAEHRVELAEADRLARAVLGQQDL